MASLYQVDIHTNPLIYESTTTAMTTVNTTITTTAVTLTTATATTICNGNILFTDFVTAATQNNINERAN